MTRLEELKRERDMIVYPRFMFMAQVWVDETDLYKKQMFMDILNDYSKKITELNDQIEKGEK